MPTPVIDPWALDASGNPDPFFNLDLSRHPEDEDLNLPNGPIIPVDPYPVMNPEIVVVQGDHVVPQEITTPVDIEPEGPEVIELANGGSITFQKTSKGWEAVLDNGTSAQPEVFKGKNKNELMVRMAEGKLNATQKIRELNRELKLGGQAPVAPQQFSQPHPGPRQLTADEQFEIKTELEANPDLALSKWFQKKTGKTVEELMALAEQGANVNINVSMGDVAKEFRDNNPEYYSVDKNYYALVRYIAKNKLRKTIPDNQANTVAVELFHSGYWTVESLEEAFNELNEASLLVPAPRSSAPPPPVAQQPEQTPRPNERIVRQETRPRAALGIRTGDVSPVAAPAPPKAPSVEDLDSLSDEAIAKLMQSAMQVRRQSRRT